MTDEDWLEEVDARCTRVCLMYPDFAYVMQPIQNRARMVYRRSAVEDWEQLLRDVKGMCTAAMVMYPDLDDEFRPTINKMSQL